MLVTALATAAITLTITRASLFRRLRLWVRARSFFFGTLVACPYCLSHWVALLLVLLQTRQPLNVVLSTFAVVTLAAPMQWLIFVAISHLPSTDQEPE